MTVAAARFGTGRPWTIGVEEELIVVDGRTHALAHTGVEAIAAMGDVRALGEAKPDTYSALVELASPVSATAGEGVAALSALRARLRATGAVAIGAGIHPDAAFGDVEHVPEARYAAVVAQLGGLIRRTPTCALHVHVGVPDAETAIRACNGMRAHLPLLQALAANSPFWFGHDSRLATARAQLFRAYPRAEIPRAFAGYDDYAASVASVVAAGDLLDYTFLWWDVRPHPNLGTVEVRAMDSQSALWSAAALAALVQCLVRAEAGRRRAVGAARGAHGGVLHRRARRAGGAAAARLRDWRASPTSRRRRWIARARTRATSASSASSAASSASSPRATARTASAPPTRAAGWRPCSSCSSRRPPSPTLEAWPVTNVTRAPRPARSSPAAARSGCAATRTAGWCRSSTTRPTVRDDRGRREAADARRPEPGRLDAAGLQVDVDDVPVGEPVEDRHRVGDRHPQAAVAGGEDRAPSSSRGSRSRG